MTIIYRAPSAARVSRIAKGLSLVPPGVVGALAVKSSKLVTLSFGVKVAVSAIATTQVAIPFAFYERALYKKSGGVAIHICFKPST